MQLPEFAAKYQSKTDEELLHLAYDAEQLTPEAQVALRVELARRRITPAAVTTVREIPLGHPADTHSSQGAGSLSVSRLMVEISRLYRGHFRIFIELSLPAVVIGYVAVLFARTEVREIARQIPSMREILRYPRELLEMWSLNLTAYAVSWVSSCAAFAGIAITVQQLESGAAPTFWDCVAKLRQKSGPFLRLSLVLYVLALMGMAVLMAIFTALFWLMSKDHISMNLQAVWILTYALFGVGSVIFARLWVSVAVLILENCRPGKAIFRSDEITEGRWILLAALVFKALVSAYVAGMLPYWVSSWLLVGVRLPWWWGWVLDITSLVGVSIVEPILFIGFSLIYLQQSAATPVATLAAARQPI